MDFREFVERIQSALDTDETGEALIEVARNAHKAELKLALVRDIASKHVYSQILSQLIIEAID
jgi:hypothetical protein